VTYGHGAVTVNKQFHEVRGLSDDTTSIVRSASLMRFRFCAREAEEDGLPAVGREAAPQHDPNDKTRQAILLLSRALTTSMRGPATVDAVTVAGSPHSGARRTRRIHLPSSAMT
jgi:hypothetical protein